MDAVAPGVGQIHEDHSCKKEDHKKNEQEFDSLYEKQIIPQNKNSLYVWAAFFNWYFDSENKLLLPSNWIGIYISIIL